MTEQEQHRKLARLLSETAAAHGGHGAGRDPEWPLLYARALHAPLSELLGVTVTQSRLTQWLLSTEEAHKARNPERDWADFYAQRLLEHHAASSTAGEDRLTLYYQPICFYCRRVMQLMQRLQLDHIELRNTLLEPDARAALLEARGRATVPVLHIQTPDDEERWMPESADIIHYLKEMYG